MCVRFGGRHFSKCACSERKTRTRSCSRPRTDLKVAITVIMTPNLQFPGYIFRNDPAATFAWQRTNISVAFNAWKLERDQQKVNRNKTMIGLHHIWASVKSGKPTHVTARFELKTSIASHGKRLVFICWLSQKNFVCHLSFWFWKEWEGSLIPRDAHMTRWPTKPWSLETPTTHL